MAIKANKPKEPDEFRNCAAQGAGLETEVQQLRLPFPSAPEHPSRVTRAAWTAVPDVQGSRAGTAMLSLCPQAALQQEQLLGGAGSQLAVLPGTAQWLLQGDQ